MFQKWRIELENYLKMELANGKIHTPHYLHPALPETLKLTRGRIMYMRDQIKSWDDIKECATYAAKRMIRRKTAMTEKQLVDYTMGVLRAESIALKAVNQCLSLVVSTTNG